MQRTSNGEVYGAALVDGVVVDWMSSLVRVNVTAQHDVHTILIQQWLQRSSHKFSCNDSWTKFLILTQRNQTEHAQIVITRLKCFSWFYNLPSIQWPTLELYQGACMIATSQGVKVRFIRVDK